MMLKRMNMLMLNVVQTYSKEKVDSGMYGSPYRETSWLGFLFSESLRFLSFSFLES